MPNKKNIYFENLDGFRFLCFLSIFFYHSFHTKYEYIKDNDIYIFITRHIFVNGNLGVNFFFVLSGFLITYFLILEKQNTGKINIIFFWIKRILRIWPLFYVCVFFGFFIFPFLKEYFGQTPNETASIFYYLTFTNNFDFINSGLPDSSNLGVLWSIAIEEQFYLIWPLFLYLFPVRKYWILFIIIILISLIFRFYNQSHTMFEYHTLSCINDMAIGSLGAWLILMNKNFEQIISDLSKKNIFIIYVFFILIFFFRKQIFFNDFFTIFDRLIISTIILFIILEQCFSKKSYYKMSNNKIFSYLGKYTYGLYCLHFIAILIIITITDKLGLNKTLEEVLILETFSALTLSILISWFSFNFFENKFLRLKGKYNSIFN